MAATAAPRRPGLDRRAISDAGFALIETGGLDALTMRDVAARLGVQAPALYWHVAGKADLIALMADRIYADARTGHVSTKSGSPSAKWPPLSWSA